ncbi:hypothetical protein J7I81_17830 [Bacillus sp. ISL-32]|uniref:hypothetical protein n=1 Tax=Bacillus atrophaeus TaxID=1452 RepID=UPI001BEB3554|nr:hypothetical protein [Bacillus atrophaeus]MBT2627187.1 hypothetical protein [Bacillus sp. ISL-32]MCG8395690.1 hypothetical protein [Bacillus atrophaeus]
MIQVYRYDEDFIFIEPVIIEKDNNGNYVIPENCTEVEPVSFYKAKFDINKQKWFESATQEYIDSLKPLPPEPSEMDILAEKVANLYYLVAMGG